VAKVCCHPDQFTINSSHYDTEQSLVFPAFWPVFITITPPEKHRVKTTVACYLVNILWVVWLLLGHPGNCHGKNWKVHLDISK